MKLYFLNENHFEKVTICFFVCFLLYPQFPLAAEETAGMMGVSVEEAESYTATSSPSLLQITSETFVDENVWYSAKTGVFSWDVPDDVLNVAVEFGTSSKKVPEENENAISSSSVNHFVLSDQVVTDGIFYLSVNFLNQDGWGVPVRKKLQIDTVAPEPFVVRISTQPSEQLFPVMYFGAVDETSGIDYYEVTIADLSPVHIAASQARFGYPVTSLQDGLYNVVVVAVDMAGNVRESNGIVLVSTSWFNQVHKNMENKILILLVVGIVFLMLIIISLMLYLRSLKIKMKEQSKKVHVETKEIQMQMEKIFSALRDEIYVQIESISKRKGLSVKEKEVFASIEQTLEVSEILIEKEINDVKVLLH